MKKKISIIIIFIILIAAVVFAVYKMKEDEPVDANTTSNNEIELSYSEPLETNLMKIQSEYYFQYLINAVNKYYETIENGKEEKILELIDEKYKDIVKIENNKLEKYYIDIYEVYMNEQSNNLSSFIVNVNIFNKNTKEVTTEKIVVRIDFENSTFSVVPSKYIENIENFKEGDSFEISATTIKENSSNKLEIFNGASYYILTEYYYNKIKNLSLYETEKAYAMLDEKYKNENCKTLEEYKDIVKKLFDEKCEVTHYRRRVNSNEDITIECKDSKENEYIIIIDFQDTGLTKFVFYKKA